MADESQTSGGTTGNNNSATGPAPTSSSEYIKLRVVGQVRLIFEQYMIQNLIYHKSRYIGGCYG